MNKELPKIYEPSKYEKSIYNKWLKSGYFNPDNLDLPDNAPTYTITLPPPNITDKLHLGHSAMLAIEDLLIRYHRMKGYRTLWVPGTDHAAIATQNVVEKKLLKEQDKSRHDLGREKFLEKVWEFLKETQIIILDQTKKMGSSLDWDRNSFTLDEQRVKAVKQMFINMYEAGVIYRGERIVNWCPRCHSTLADDEIEYKGQKTIFYTFKYSKDFPFAISTTRPETKLGDTAIAINPKDERYKKYIGKIYDVDFVGIKLKLKIIADRHVDMNFGTGALGVTPAHSMADWQMAEKNNLEIIKVINENGKINNNFQEYSNKTVEKARTMIVKKLKEDNLLEKEEEIENNLSICYRCGTAIEPLPSKQWFINVNKKLKRLENKSLKEKAIEAVKDKSIKFIPNRFEKRYIDWMENLHDWCISRQIWFGHRIPVWYRHKIQIKNSKFNNDVYVGIKPPKGDDWIQDEDSLDTWFSSGMWTFSTLGWPDNFKDGKKICDLQKFHPTQVLDTGYDILTLWVSRMIMMSLFALQEIPFENVYLHGMVLDEYGKKMSKSKGNGINPIDMIEKYGTDAIRLALLIGSTPGNDVKISEEKIAGFRNLVNKIWNISRFVLGNIVEAKLHIGSLASTNKLTLADEWILSKFKKLIKQINDDLDNYRFSQAGEILRDFTWNDFADWYLEASKFKKSRETENILIFVLKNLLKLWHPFIPFVTEKIWEELGSDKLLMIEKWPKPSYKNYDLNNFNLIKDIIISIRNIRAENKVAPSRKIKAILFAKNNKYLIDNKELIKRMKTGISNLEIKEKKENIQDAIKTVVGDVEIYLLEVIDKEKEKENIKKKIKKKKKIIANIEKKLSNKQFIEQAPKKIVNQEKDKLILRKKELKKLKLI